MVCLISHEKSSATGQLVRPVNVPIIKAQSADPGAEIRIVSAVTMQILCRGFRAGSEVTKADFPPAEGIGIVFVFYRSISQLGLVRGRGAVPEW
ncbi:hypothetical protein [Roseibium sp. M-1]